MRRPLGSRTWPLRRDTANRSYWYTASSSPVALVALAAGIAPRVPGFIGTVSAIRVSPLWIDMYNYARFISFGLSLAVYAVLMKAVNPGRHEHVAETETLRT